MEHKVGDRIEITNMDDDRFDSMVGRQGVIVSISTLNDPPLMYPFKVKMDVEDDEDPMVFTESEFINLTHKYNNKLNNYISE